MANTQKSVMGVPRVRECRVCGDSDKKIFVCSRCHVIYYCSKECQKNDWSRHKEFCSPRLISLVEKRKKIMADIPNQITSLIMVYNYIKKPCVLYVQIVETIPPGRGPGDSTKEVSGSKSVYEIRLLPKTDYACELDRDSIKNPYDPAMLHNMYYIYSYGSAETQGLSMQTLKADIGLLANDTAEAEIINDLPDGEVLISYTAGEKEFEIHVLDTDKHTSIWEETILLSDETHDTDVD